LKPYGLVVVEYPDVSDIHAMGAKSICGRFPVRGGKSRGYFKNKAVKAQTRRYWARKARAANKAACQEE